MNTRYSRIKQKHDATENWTANNPILLEGEIGYDTDLKAFKIGDGTTAWNDLSYHPGAVSAENGSEIFNDYKNNKAVSENSSAHGINTTAGSKAFKIIGFNDTNKTYTLDSVDGLAVNDIFSLWLINNYDNYGKITAVNATAKTITVDNYVADEGRIDGKGNLFRIAAKPLNGTTDFGIGAFSEGGNTNAQGMYAHAEGYTNNSYGKYSHTEGTGNEAAYASHAEGKNNKATGFAAHAEGQETSATTWSAHSEGEQTIASNHAAHAEGFSNEASGLHSHAEGSGNIASGVDSHAQGNITKAIGDYSTATGQYTSASGQSAIAAGAGMQAISKNAVAIGQSGFAGSKAFKIIRAESGDDGGHMTDRYTLDSVEGLSAGDVCGIDDNGACGTIASITTNSKQVYVYRNNGFVSGTYFRIPTKPDKGTVDFGENAIATGKEITGSGKNSHTEGLWTNASGTNAHAENKNSNASGENSHAEGYATIAGGTNQHVQGKFNEADYTNKYAHIVGGGTDWSNRKNIHTINWNGTAWFANDIKIGGNSETSDDAYSVITSNNAVGRKSSNPNSEIFNDYENNSVSSFYSHAEGRATHALGFASHTEGGHTVTRGDYSHAEGQSTEASGIASHSEGQKTKAISDGASSHGIETFAGAKCFNIQSFESSSYVLDSIEGLEVGDTFSLNLKNEHDNCGKITAIDTTTKTVTVDNFVPAEDGATVNYFRVAAKPEIGTTDFGEAAFAEGYNTKAVAPYAHTEGISTTVIGNNGHAEGRETVAVYAAHAEGEITKAMGYASHTEGANTQALAQRAHAEGETTTASGFAAHSEGNKTTASGSSSHSEGGLTEAAGYGAHAEGDQTKALKNSSHAEGYKSVANSNGAHAEGGETSATGSYSHAEGTNTKAVGNKSHAEGANSTANGGASHAEGSSTATGHYSHSEGRYTKANGENSHSEGYDTTAEGSHSHTEGMTTTASGYASHAEGCYTRAYSQYSHVEGMQTITGCTGLFGTLNWISMKEFDYNSITFDQSIDLNINDKIVIYGQDFKLLKIATVVSINNKTVQFFDSIENSQITSTRVFVCGINKEIGTTIISSIGQYSHAEGLKTQSNGNSSHAEGANTFSLGYASHSEGDQTKALANGAHSEGYLTIANRDASHAEGNVTLAQGLYSHAEGSKTQALGNISHAEGKETIASGNYQHVEGQYNIKDTSNQYAHIVGNGTSDTNRSNAYTLDWDGNANFAGNISTLKGNAIIYNKTYKNINWTFSDWSNGKAPYIESENKYLNELYDFDKYDISITLSDETISTYYNALAEAGLVVLSTGGLFIGGSLDNLQGISLIVNIDIYYRGEEI